MSAAITATTLCLGFSGLSEANITEAPVRKETRIPAEDLSAALSALEKDRNLELIFVAEDVRGIHTRGARGRLTVDEALKMLLTGTGLIYHVDRNTVAIVPAQSSNRGDGPPVGRASGETATDERSALEEVIVTAEKRRENVQNVPSSVSVIGGSTLEELGATQLADFAAYAPGLSVVQGASPGQDMLIMRGLSTAAPTALIGTYLDDTPIGASSAQLQTSWHALDLLPYDFDRVEVLEGPQGTLYGANTMGGLVKYVTRKPDLDNGSVRVGADFKENDNASAVGWNVHTSVNLPIVAGKSALRVSVSGDVTPGFIDEPNQNQTNGNQVRDQAGHVALLLEPADAWSADLSALTQHLYAPNGGSVTLTPSTFTPDIGPRANSQRVPQTFESRLQYYSASIIGDLEWASLASTTGYSMMRSSEQLQFYFPVDQPTGRAETEAGLSLNKFTQEFRLVSPGDGRLEWLLGAFYTDEQGDQPQSVYALNTANAAVPNPLLNPEIRLADPSHYREYAAFGNATWKFTDTFALTVGMRESRNQQSFAGIPVCSAVYDSTLGVCPPVGAGSSHEGVFNFTVSPSYHFSPDIMTYVRLASGYRPGSANVPLLGIPGSIQADTLINYEAGIKSAWHDRKLQLHAALYQIDWKHIQVTALAPPPLDVSYGENGNTATVRGFETAAKLSPISSLQLGLNVAFTHAVLTEPMPSNSTLVGNSGDRLPYVPIWSSSLTAEYTRPVRLDWMGTLGAGWRYTGQRYTTVNNPGNCPTNCAGAATVPSLMPYWVIDMHGGVSNDRWSLRFAVRNLTNKTAWVNMNGYVSPPFDTAPIVATALSGRLVTMGVDRRF
jgi:iron complex outermembrane recepter protein